MSDTTIHPDEQETPGPGLYPDVPAEIYHGWAAVSNSWLSQLRRSPAHLRHCLDHGFGESEAKTIGTAVHAATLEPHKFAELYAIGPDVKLNTKEGKEQWGQFVEANPGKAHLRGEVGAAVLGMREAILAHPKARQLLEATGLTEVSAVWNDAETGLRCKMRADRLLADAAIIWDLKTTSDASPEAFARDAGKFGYYRQSAFYLHGIAGFCPCDLFLHIVVESKPPYAVGVYAICDSDIELGWRHCQRLLQKYAECQQRREWPGYCDGIRTISLPAWATSGIEE